MQEGADGHLLAILSYHKIGEAPPGAWQPWQYVPEGMLREHLAALREDGWEFVDLAAALHSLVEPGSLSVRSVLVTFDDGYRSLFERGLPILAEFACPGVVFVPTAYVGGMNTFDRGLCEPLEPLCGWPELRELEAGGISVQSHGFRHLRLSKADPREVERELRMSKEALEDGLGKPVEVLAFPYGDGGTDPAQLNRALQRFGYRAACLYGGRAVRLPPVDVYRLPRVAVGFSTDLLAELIEPGSRSV